MQVCRILFKLSVAVLQGFTGQVWEAHSAPQRSCLQYTQPISVEETATWDGCYSTCTQQEDVASQDWLAP